MSGAKDRSPYKIAQAHLRAWPGRRFTADEVAVVLHAPAAHAIDVLATLVDRGRVGSEHTQERSPRGGYLERWYIEPPPEPDDEAWA